MQAAAAFHRTWANPEDSLGTRTLTLSDRRVLAFHVVGAADGPTLFHHHASPGSRLDVAAIDGIARELGVRVVGVDRPGIGRSSPRPTGGPCTFAQDIAVLADHLGAERFCVSGAEEGAAFALACASAIPAERMRLAILCAPGVARTSQEIVEAAAARMTVPARDVAGVVAWDARSTAEWFWNERAATASGYDCEVLSRPSVRPALVASTRESVRNGPLALLRDIAQAGCWNVDCREVKGEVEVWGGGDAALAAGARQVAIPGAGRLVFLGEIDGILGRVKAALR
ncbi:MAG: alpha/beta hydrolase [Bauldia sp.]|nr:alpha/beta hydrolase [Bauldia sp.]